MDKIAVVKDKVKYAEWIAMVETCRNSGLPITTWCKENFISCKTYYYRLRKLRSMFISVALPRGLREVTDECSLRKLHAAVCRISVPSKRNL